ncbi:MAG: DMT family transporter [Eubacteriales bacterium]
MINRNVLAHGVALVTILIWGTTFVATKILLEHFSPVEILFIRFVLGYASLACVSIPEYISKKKQPARTLRRELYFAAAGLTGVTLYFLLENIALTYSFASNVGIIVAIAPIFAALFASLFLVGEKITVRFFLGFVVAISGIILVSLNGKFALALNPLGDVLAALAAIVWAVYSVIQKKIQAFGYSVIVLTRKTFFYGLIFMIPALAKMGFNPDIQILLKPEIFLPFLYLGIGACAVCFATWNFALHVLGAMKTSAYIYLVPFVDILFAAWILKEKITWAAIAGTLLILSGLYLSERRSRRPVSGITAGDVVGK